MTTFTHEPVLRQRCLDLLAPAISAHNAVLVDATLGLGGHTESALTEFPNLRVIGIDRDPEALAMSQERLAKFAPRVDFALAVYDEIPEVLANLNIEHVQGILFDLGVSSMQLDNPARGFTSKLAGPLDMRMNPGKGIPASKWLERVTPAELAEILRENSDEPHAQILAPQLAAKSISSTLELAQAIRAALSSRPEEELKKTVARVFQAIRIEVNEEFAALDALLRSLPFSLRLGGRVAILTFHSGEDRRVKKAFQAGQREGIYSEIARDVIRASAAECRANPRATSAKLRWARR